MRFIKELLKPATKCERVGHKNIKRYRKTFRRPDANDWRFYSVMSCKESKEHCPRCKQDLSEWEVYDKEGFRGYSMPSSMAEELRENGVVRI